MCIIFCFHWTLFIHCNSMQFPPKLSSLLKIPFHNEIVFGFDVWIDKSSHKFRFISNISSLNVEPNHATFPSKMKTKILRIQNSISSSTNGEIEWNLKDRIYLEIPFHINIISHNWRIWKDMYVELCRREFVILTHLAKHFKISDKFSITHILLNNALCALNLFNALVISKLAFGW